MNLTHFGTADQAVGKPSAATIVAAEPGTARLATRRQEAWARALTWLYAAGAAASIVLWLVDHWDKRTTTWIEVLFGLLNVPVSNSLVSVVVLVLLTRALVGRKRVGLIVVMGFQVLFFLLSLTLLTMLFLAQPEDVTEIWGDSYTFGALVEASAAIPAILILALCWWMRPAFPARLRPGSWAVLFGTLAGGFALTIAVTWGILAILKPGRPHYRWVRAIFLNSLGYSSSVDRPLLGEVSTWIALLSSVLVSATIIIAVVLFMRSARVANEWSADRELAVRRALHQYGDQDSLSYFATRRDRSAVFSNDGRAAVSYGLIAGVSLASGDPVGERASWPGAIAVWKQEARQYGWVPAAIAVSEDAARAYIEAGFDAVPLGDEAILYPENFRLNNTSMTDVRRAVQHARRLGLTVQVRRQQDIPAAELGDLVALADVWRDGDTERGFSMALDRRGDPSDGRTVYVTVHDADGTVKGLLSFVPWGARGLSLDTMRRHPQAPNGTNELMVTELMAAAPELGVRRVSLNFAFLRGVFADAERLGAGTLTRLNSSLLGGLDRFFQLERLYRSNQKFDPIWQPRYVCFDSRLSMPQVALACGAAEGFLPRPFHRHGAPALDDDQVAEVRRIEAVPPVTAESLAPRRGDQTRVRLQHLARMRAQGKEPYPVGVAPATPVAALEPTLWEDRPQPVRVTGRVHTVRDHGGVAFIRLVDGERAVQLVAERDALTRAGLRSLIADVDGGDILVVDAHPGASRNGTPSLLVDEARVVAKSLHPIPFGAFNDADARLRQRSTDLIVHPKDAELLRLRSHVVRAVRRTLDDSGFLEVETPILHTVHGGASARPFKTFINAYGVDLSMRIAPELYLKRLVVGGMGPIYEIGRNFRNEGADATHNPEFTSLEAYEPFGDYTTMRLLTERIIKEAATAVHGGQLLPLRLEDQAPDALSPGGLRLFDVSGPWPVVPVLAAVSEAVGRPIDLDTDFEVLLDLARRHDIPTRPDMGPGAIIEELYGEIVEPATVRPTFYTDFPVETSPLTGPHRRIPGLVERWDLVANGMEIGTAYSELTDPVEQRRRLTEQSLKAAAGDAEAMEIDEDFLRALETGMPPSGGLGIGVDRLVMLLTETNIRQVLTFPFVRPR